MSLTAELDRLTVPAAPFEPEQAMAHAVRSITETCKVQFERMFEPCEEIVDLELATCGSSISLTDDRGGMVLAILCDRDTGESLTRRLFDLKADEEILPVDMADALNEILNVAAGVFKSLRREAGQVLSLGLPLYLESGNSIRFSGSSTRGQSRLIRHADGTAIQIHLMWRKGTGN